MSFPLRVSVLAMVAVSACGGSVLETADDSGAIDASATISDASLDAWPDATHVVLEGGSGDSGPIAPCPLVEPPAGASCTENELACEYGSSPQVDCNDIVTCSGGTWSTPQLLQGPPPTFCGATNPICPTTFGVVLPAGACDGDLAIICNYPEGACGCVHQYQQTDAGVTNWTCVTPTPGCPTTRPLLGTSCVGNEECDWSGCIADAYDEENCVDGVWVHPSHSSACDETAGP